MARENFPLKRAFFNKGRLQKKSKMNNIDNLSLWPPYPMEIDSDNANGKLLFESRTNINLDKQDKRSL